MTHSPCQLKTVPRGHLYEMTEAVVKSPAGAKCDSHMQSHGSAKAVGLFVQANNITDMPSSD